MATHSRVHLLLANITISLFVLLALVPQTAQHFEPFTNKDNPFGFMKNLQGCMKGQKVDGLHKVKKYLANFGYLEKKLFSKNEVDTNDTAEFFDENLEKSIKTYQNNYRLNVTVYLDAATIKQMMMPPCGFPDIINGKNTMHSKNKPRNNKNQKSMNGTSLYATMGSKWPSSQYNLAYQILSETLVPGTENMNSIVNDALNKWAQYSPFTFKQVSEGSQPDLVFGAGGVLGHSFRPTDGRSHYDGTENWSENPDQNQMDINSVVLHEIGHILGLAHSQHPNAVMYPSIGPGVQKRVLQEDDIQGIEALYNSN